MAKLNIDMSAVKAQFEGLNGRHPGLWPALPRFTLFLGVAVLVLALGWYFYWMGLLETLDRERAQEGQLRAQYVDKMKQAANLPELLGRIGWPDTVLGCALAVERTLLPAGHEGELPADPQRAAAFVANHPQRQDLRLVVGVLRGGTSDAVARLQCQPGELLGGPQLAPGVAEVLAATLA